VNDHNFPIFKMDRTKALLVLQSSLYPGAALESIEMVLGWCEARGVDPLDKPCHIVPMFDKKSNGYRDVIMPSVDYYRQKAESTGEYIGLSDTEYGTMQTLTVADFTIDYPEWARIVVKRLVQGQVAEFPAKVFWTETYATKGRDTKVPNAMWTKRPIGQLEKCAEAQALRRAFPKLCGGPTAEEMHGKALNDAIDVESVRVEGPKSLTESATPATVVDAPRVAPVATQQPAVADPVNAAPVSQSVADGPPPVGAELPPAAPGAAPHTPLKPAQQRILTASLARAGKTEEDLRAKYGVLVAAFPFEKFNEAQKWLSGGDK